MNKTLRNNQRGLVSVTVTLVIMIIVTLVVSSFALIVRREQRRTLDRQLSAQAFYAAEAGIADARSALASGAIKDDVTACENTDTNSFVHKTSQYTSPTGDHPAYSGTISNNISYSCVLIDQTLQDYTKDNVAPEDGSFVANIKSGDPTKAINSLRISWQNNDPANTIKKTDTTYSLNRDIDGPMLRITVFPGFNGSTLSKDDINNGSHTMFLYPNATTDPVESIDYLGSGGGHNSTDPKQGQFVHGNCNTTNASPYACNVNITGMDAQEYFVVVQALYKTAKVSLSAYNGATELTLSGGQAEIDVTGKASDVLRRIRVRVPVDGGFSVGDFKGLFPDAAISTTDTLCKRLVYKGTTYDDECDNKQIKIDDPPVTDPDKNGNADIVDYGATNHGQKKYSTTDNYYEFRAVLKNDSKIDPGTLLKCEWDWGDGTVESFPATDSRCKKDTNVGHVYPNMAGLISRTNGYRGCYKYIVTLTNYFTASSNIKAPAEKKISIFVPFGIANDPVNTITGIGICSGKYIDSPKPPIAPDSNPSMPGTYWTTFPVKPPYP